MISPRRLFGQSVTMQQLVWLTKVGSTAKANLAPIACASSASWRKFIWPICRFTQTAGRNCGDNRATGEATEEHFQIAMRQRESFPGVLEQADIRRFHAMMLIDRAAEEDHDRARGIEQRPRLLSDNGPSYLSAQRLAGRSWDEPYAWQALPSNDPRQNRALPSLAQKPDFARGLLLAGLARSAPVPSSSTSTTPGAITRVWAILPRRTSTSAVGTPFSPGSRAQT
jgi:hypothetical protein